MHDSSNIEVHLSDVDFTSRCVYQDAYVLPLLQALTLSSSVSPLVESGNSAVELPSAVLVSPWLLSPSTSSLTSSYVFEYVTLGWRCPGCGIVEPERLQWQAPPVPASNQRRQHQQCARHMSERRATKEAIRRRALAVAPRCTTCVMCPRCSGLGEAAHTGELGAVVSLGALHTQLTHNSMEYYVACPCCGWHSCRSFSAMPKLTDYLHRMLPTRAEALRGWRQAQHEMQSRVRLFMDDNFGEEGSVRGLGAKYTITSSSRSGNAKAPGRDSKNAGAYGNQQSKASETVSQAAWRLFTELQCAEGEATGHPTRSAAAGSSVVSALQYCLDEQQESELRAMMAETMGEGAAMSSSTSLVLEKLRTIVIAQREQTRRVAAGKVVHAEGDGGYDEGERSERAAGAPDEAEGTWYGHTQCLQSGLPLHLTTTRRVPLHPSASGAPHNTFSSSRAASGVSATPSPSRTTGAVAMSAQQAMVQAMINDDRNAAFLSTLYLYCIRNVLKEAISVLVCRPRGNREDCTRKAASCVGENVMVDRDDGDADVASVMAFWAARNEKKANKEEEEKEFGAEDKEDDDGAQQKRRGPSFVTRPVSAARCIPFLRHIHRPSSPCYKDGVGPAAATTTAAGLVGKQQRYTFCWINLGLHDMVIRNVRVGMQVGGGSTPVTLECPLLQTLQDSGRLICLKPRCCAAEAEAAGLAGELAASPAALTPLIAKQCSVSVKEIYFDLVWDSIGGAEGTGHDVRMVGLVVEVFTHVSRVLDKRVSTKQESSHSGEEEERQPILHSVTYGTCISF